MGTKKGKIQDDEYENVQNDATLETMYNELKELYFNIGQVRTNALYQETHLGDIKSTLKQLKSKESELYETIMAKESELIKYKENRE